MTSIASDLIERLDKLIEHQRRTRGDYLDYGQPDPELIEAKQALSQLTREVDELRGLLEKAEKFVPSRPGSCLLRGQIVQALSRSSGGMSDAE